MTAHDLKTAAGLRAALDAAGSWAQLSRDTGVPASTLKSRGKTLGVSAKTSSVGLAELAPARPSEIGKPTGRSIGQRTESDDLMDALVARRREDLEAILDGEAVELSITDFNLFVELDMLLKKDDHQRLLRAASLTIQGGPKRFHDSTAKRYIQQVAAACRVDAKALDAYVLVLQGEIQHRRGTGQSPLEGLPNLTKTEQTSSASTGKRDRGQS